ncbi:MAG: hypothetical protein PHG95_00110 [Patescibacteria group bacterium]|nr:hypothetical protein [Patescibacteria group bacterium]
MIAFIVPIVIVALAIGLIVSPTFRQGVVTVVTDVVTIVFGVTRQYALIAGVTIAVMFFWMFLALMIGSPIFSGLVFIAAIAFFFVVWLPLGAVLKIFGVNNAVVPASVRSFFAWMAFVGFMAMMTPDVFTLKTTLIASLVAIFMAMLTSKFNLLEKVVLPLVVIMCLIGAWKLIAPDSFRAVDRHRLAIGSLFTTANDRGSLRKETRAASTFGKLIKDVPVVYMANMNGEEISQLTEIQVSLPKGTIVLLCDQKKEVSIFQGQSFIEVRLPNSNGSFVNGQRYWIESNLLEIGTMASLTPAETSREERRVVRDTVISVSFGPGTHQLQLKPGQIVRLMTTPSKDGCGLLSMSSPTYAYQFKFDGHNWEADGPAVQYPYMRYPTCLLRSQSGDILTIKVL